MDGNYAFNIIYANFQYITRMQKTGIWIVEQCMNSLNVISRTAMLDNYGI